jgi:E3 ubiquitin-protein ligase DOA10
MGNYVGASRIKISSDGKQAEANMCSICLGQFEDGEEVISLHCHKAHIFHERCILEWSKNKKECPLCRKHVEFGNI